MGRDNMGMVDNDRVKQLSGLENTEWVLLVWRRTHWSIKNPSNWCLTGL
jgi:hypothetical protein